MEREVSQTPASRIITLATAYRAAIPPSPALLSMLSNELYEEVLNIAEHCQFDIDDYLFKQGSEHNGIYIIKNGLIRSYYASEDDREITLGFWSDGDYVGAPQIFGGGQHTWSSVALTPSDCMWLPGSKLKALSVRWPELSLTLIDALVNKAQSYCVLLQLLATNSMRMRLAKLLALMGSRRSAQNFPMAISVSHYDIANMIGSTRQWVSQTLLEFERKGWISRQKKGIILINNPDELNALK